MRALGLLPLPVSRGPRDACVAGWLNGERESTEPVARLCINISETRT